MSIHEHFSEQELKLLKARAERAASTAQKKGAGNVITALQIKLGSESYALPVEFLRAVYERVTVVPVPCTPTFIAGIANVRGRIIPILDLADLLDIPRAPDNMMSALVVASTEDTSLALLVDSVGEITSFSEASLSPLPAGGEMLEKGRYLEGVLADGRALLDLSAILNDPALVVEDVQT